MKSDTNIHLDDQQGIISFGVMVTEVILEGTEWGVVIKQRMGGTNYSCKIIGGERKEKSGNSRCDIVT